MKGGAQERRDLDNVPGPADLTLAAMKGGARVRRDYAVTYSKTR